MVNPSLKTLLNMFFLNHVAENIRARPAVFCAGVILLFGILSRIIFWLVFHPQDIPENRSLSFYEIAVERYFIDYLTYYHTKPLGMLIVDKFILLFTEQVVYGRLLLISVLDILASLILFHFLQRIHSHVILNITIAFIFSFTLIGWEFWRKSYHFDHANVFLFLLVGWTYFELIRNLNIKTAVNFSLSIVVLSLFHALGFIIAFGLVALVTMNNAQALNKKVIAVLLISIVFTNLPNLKNYIQVGVFAPSTVGGHNAFQLVSNASLDHTNSLINTSIAPEWWKWCYREAVNKDLNVYNGIYGQCFDHDKTKAVSNLDFSKMRQVAVDLNEDNLVAIIENDLETAATRPWRLVGGVNESNTRFSVEYGKIGYLLWIDAIMNNPKHIITLIGKTIIDSIRGSLIMYKVNYEPRHQTDNVMVKAAGFIIGWMAILGLVASTFWVTLNFARMVFALLNQGPPVGACEQFYLGVGLLSWGVIVTFAMTTCCENPRMTFPLVGLSIVTFYFTIQQLVIYWNKKIKDE